MIISADIPALAPAAIAGSKLLNQRSLRFPDQQASDELRQTLSATRTATAQLPRDVISRILQLALTTVQPEVTPAQRYSLLKATSLICVSLAGNLK